MSKTDSPNRFLMSLYIVCLLVGMAISSLTKASENQMDPNHETRLRKELGSPFITNYIPKEYNAAPQNWAAVQDHRGVMYIANNSGILEFDGKTFRLIRLPNRLAVRTLGVGKNGTVYVGGNGEIGYLASDEKGNMKYYSLLERIPEEHRSFGYIYSLLATHQGVFFISYENIFHWVDDTLETIPVNLLKKPMGQYIHGKIIILDYKNVSMYQLIDNKFEALPYLQKVSNYRKVSLLPYPGNRMLILTEQGKFFVYDLGVLDQDPESVDPEMVVTELTTEASEYLSVNKTFFPTVYNGQYIFPTVGGGILIMDQDGKLVRIINENRGLLSDLVWNVFVDRDQNLWALMNEGIAQIEISSPLSIYNKLNGIKNYVLAIERHKERLYLASFDGVYVLTDNKVSAKDDRHKLYHLKETTLNCFTFNLHSALSEDSFGELFIS